MCFRVCLSVCVTSHNQHVSCSLESSKEKGAEAPRTIVRRCAAAARMQKEAFQRAPQLEVQFGTQGPEPNARGFASDARDALGTREIPSGDLRRRRGALEGVACGVPRSWDATASRVGPLMQRRNEQKRVQALRWATSHQRRNSCASSSARPRVEKHSTSS